MHLLNHEQRAGISAGIEALIIGEASLGAPTGPVAAVESCGGRVVAQVDWQDAVERITAMSARPIILMEAAALGDEALATALARLDGLAAGRDLALIVGITEHQIDLAAAGLVQSRYEILCDPAEADWITALATAHLADPLVLHDRVSEGNIGRIAQLNAEVARITNVLANLTRHETPIRPAAINEPKLSGYGVEPVELHQVSPVEVRQIVRARRMRDRHFGEGMFEDPAWDMMLDLYAAHLERAQVSVSSLCIAAAVAPTTALRWIARLTNAGLFQRTPDPFDRRRAFMSLTDAGLTAMSRYVSSIRAMGLPLV